MRMLHHHVLKVWELFNHETVPCNNPRGISTVNGTELVFLTPWSQAYLAMHDKQWPLTGRNYDTHLFYLYNGSWWEVLLHILKIFMCSTSFLLQLIMKELLYGATERFCLILHISWLRRWCTREDYAFSNVYQACSSLQIYCLHFEHQSILNCLFRHIAQSLLR